MTYGYFVDSNKQPVDFAELEVRHLRGKRINWFIKVPQYRLRHDLTFIDPSGEEWNVLEGYVFNGGSIPWYLWWLCSADQPDCFPAFCLHDWLCESGECTRKKADWLFWTAMRAQGYYRWGSFRNWVGVRIGAGVSSLKRFKLKSRV